MNRICTSLTLAVCCALNSCAINRGTINSYVDPTYTQGAITRLAVFSIRNAGRAPSEARRINAELARAISEKNPEIEVVAPSAALRGINEANLAKEWADFVEDYYTSGIANQVLLTKVAEALGVEAVLQGQLENVFQQDGNGWDQRGVTRITISFSIVEAATGKRIWEAASDGIRGNATEFGPAPPVADAIETAMAKILANLPTL